MLGGYTAQSMHDVGATPLNETTPGPVLHLETMAAALAHQFLRPTPPGWMFALVIMGGVSAWLLIAFVRRPLVCLCPLVGAGAAYLLASRLAYDRAGYSCLPFPSKARSSSAVSRR